jgi:hypothetical protein
LGIAPVQEPVWGQDGGSLLSKNRQQPSQGFFFHVFGIDGFINAEYESMPGDIVHVDDPLCIKKEEHLPHCIDCFLVCGVWKETGDSFIVTILFRTSNKHH